MEYQDRFITVNGFRTRYWYAGTTGPVIVLVHGIGASVEHWQWIIPELAKHYRVYAYDTLGAGLTDKPHQKYTIKLHKRFLLAFIQTLNLKEVIIIGSSLGGGFSAWAAIEAQKHFQALILAAPAGIARDLAWIYRILALPIIGPLLFKPSRAKTKMKLQHGVFDKSIITESFVDKVHYLNSLPGAQYAQLSLIRDSVDLGGVKAIITRFSIRNFKKIKIPVLLIWGDRDETFHHSHGQIAMEQLSNGTLKIMENAGHVPYVERPKEFVRLVLGFLKEL